VLVLGVPALAAVVVVLVLARDSIRDTLPFVGPKSVGMKAVGSYDPPPGDGAEHDELAGRATDGKSNTYWSTEYYRSWFKPGIGLVVAAPKAEQLSKLTIKTDMPSSTRQRFVARVRAGPSPSGPFVPVSPWQTVRRKTTFDVDTHGRSYRYYLVWLRLPDGGVAHVSEVTARA
jgi:hypothetical protein